MKLDLIYVDVFFMLEVLWRLMSLQQTLQP